MTENKAVKSLKDLLGAMETLREVVETQGEAIIRIMEYLHRTNDRQLKIVKILKEYVEEAGE